MSEENKADISTFCASCGVAEDDDIQLKGCDACDLVKYCSIECQRDHTSKHLPAACKKRTAELRDELLFKQPNGTHLGDCPICMNPLPIHRSKSVIMTCCSKLICLSCTEGHWTHQMEKSLVVSCPFCRHPLPRGKENDKLTMKRIGVNDPVAMWRKGEQQYKEGDYSSAAAYFTKAAGLGNADAHFKLSIMYHFGMGVETNTEKKIYHLEEAAIAGHPESRHSLGMLEMDNVNIDRALENRCVNLDRAVRHFCIAASLGHDVSLKQLMDLSKGGFVSEEDLDAALRANQAATDATNCS